MSIRARAPSVKPGRAKVV